MNMEHTGPSGIMSHVWRHARAGSRRSRPGHAVRGHTGHLVGAVVIEISSITYWSYLLAVLEIINPFESPV